MVSAEQGARYEQLLVVVTGAESSGKTTLANWLAQRLEAPLVPEVARDYLESKAPPAGGENLAAGYGPADVRAIALEQRRCELATLKPAAAGQDGPGVVVADTDQRVINLWWEEKFGARDAAFELVPTPENVKRYYLLCYPDLPWVADPLRENPHDRLRLFRAQLRALEHDQTRFDIVWGLGSVRNARALHHLQQVLAG